MTVHRSISQSIDELARELLNGSKAQIGVTPLAKIESALRDVVEDLRLERALAHFDQRFPTRSLAEAMVNPAVLPDLAEALRTAAELAYPSRLPSDDAVDEFALVLGIDDTTLGHILTATKEET